MCYRLYTDPFADNDSGLKGELTKENETKVDSTDEDDFNLLGDSVQAVESKSSEKSEEKEDFGLPDFTSAKDLW